MFHDYELKFTIKCPSIVSDAIARKVKDFCDSEYLVCRVEMSGIFRTTIRFKITWKSTEARARHIKSAFENWMSEYDGRYAHFS